MNLEKLILDGIKDYWDDFTKARYIYIKLCQILSFNIPFNNVSDHEYNKIYRKKVNLNNLKRTEIVCSGWAYIYKKLLKRIGINAIIINKHHKWVEFKIGKYDIYADATIDMFNDLYRVKKGYKTANYGPIKVRLEEKAPILGTEYEKNFSNFYKHLEKSDEEINYKNKCLNYTNEIEKMIKKELNNNYFENITYENQSKSAYKLFKFITKIANISSLNYYDAKNHIMRLENLFFYNINFRDYIIHRELCKKEANDKVDIILITIVKQDNNEFKYFIYKIGNELIETTKEEILKFQDKGYGIKSSYYGYDSKINGIDEFTKIYNPNIRIKKEKLTKIKKLLKFINFKRKKRRVNNSYLLKK